MILKEAMDQRMASRTELGFYRDLLEKGYPEQILQVEPMGLSGFDGYRPDIVALAPGLSSDPLAVFDVWAGDVDERLRWLASKAREFCKANEECAFYMVAQRPLLSFVYRYDRGTKNFRQVRSIPCYEDLVSEWLRGVSHVSGLKLTNVTLFRSASFGFVGGLNVLIGENGFGKSTLLKLIYSQAKYASEYSRRIATGQKPPESNLEKVFGLPALSLITRDCRKPASVKTNFRGKMRGFSELVISSSGMRMQSYPPARNAIPSVVFLQSHEVLSSYHGYSALWNRYAENMSRDGTIIDTVNLLGLPTLRSQPKALQDVCSGLERSIGGRIEIDEKEGRFYFIDGRDDSVRTAIDMTAEGWRKIGQLLVLLRNGAVAPGSILIWDEPEANLNPRLEKVVAALLVGIVRAGVQVFVATHSLFFANELDIHLRKTPLESGAKFINLRKGKSAMSGGSLSEVDNIALIEESMKQSDRFLELD